MLQSARTLTVGCMAAALIWTFAYPVLAQVSTLSATTSVPEIPPVPVLPSPPPGSAAGPATAQEQLSAEVQEAAAWRIRAEEAEAQLAQSRAELLEARAKAGALIQGLAAAEQARDAMAVERDALRASLDASTVGLRESEASLERFRSQVKYLQNDVSTVRKSFVVNRTALEKRRSDYAILEHELVAIENSNAALRDRFAALEESYAHATGRVEELERNLAQVLVEREAARQMLVDHDADGVLDELDLCGQSPEGTVVGVVGCAADTPIALQGVTFRLGSHGIADESAGVLDEVAETLGRHSSLRLEVAGHTDDRGTAVANLTLSQRRAESVRAYLVERGVPENSLTARGYGPHEPVADNATASGRARNRRVELRRLPALDVK